MEAIKRELRISSWGRSGMVSVFEDFSRAHFAADRKLLSREEI